MLEYQSHQHGTLDYINTLSKTRESLQEVSVYDIWNR